MGWDIEKRWQDFFPGVSFDSWDVSFKQSLENCRLYVCDQLATTWLEALSANKPTIIFWNPKHNKLRPEAQAYFDQLRLVGILYDTPESAAVTVNTIYDDVEAWWNKPEIQAVRKKFCDSFAQTSKYSVQDWIVELKKIVKLEESDLLKDSI